MVSKVRHNVWTCEACGRSIHCQELDPGVTPFMLRCYASPGCEGSMRSRMYRERPEWSTIPVTHEWWTPTPGELDTYCVGVERTLRERGDVPEGLVPAVAGQTREHVAKGGLLLREVPGWRAQLDATDAAGQPVQARAPHDREAREALVRP